MVCGLFFLFSYSCFFGPAPTPNWVADVRVVFCFLWHCYSTSSSNTKWDPVSHLKRSSPTDSSRLLWRSSWNKHSNHEWKARSYHRQMLGLKSDNSTSAASFRKSSRSEFLPLLWTRRSDPPMMRGELYVPGTCICHMHIKNINVKKRKLFCTWGNLCWRFSVILNLFWY